MLQRAAVKPATLRTWRASAPAVCDDSAD